jgi:hypothetical protein
MSDVNGSAGHFMNLILLEIEKASSRWLFYLEAS